LVSTRPPGEPFLTVTRPFLRDVAGNALILIFFYVNYYFLVPKFYFKRKYALYATAVFVALIAVFMLPSLVTGRLLSNGGHPPPGEFVPHLPKPVPNTLVSLLLDELKHHLYLFFIALFFSLLLRIREHLADIKAEKLSAELSSLKAQINPHFLFNTLNSIYALSVKKDDKAPDAILQLSGLMRYIIKDTNNPKIPLLTEVGYLQNYVELQRARTGNTAFIIFECTGQLYGLDIAPLILITYIENAFKYGINPDADNSFVEVYIQVTGNTLQMQVRNNKVPLADNTGNSTGIGINNTSGRLNLLYPGRHTLEIKEDEKNYSVNLSINLA
jgi:hypothetical protein